MTVNELLNKLQQLSADGLGDFQILMDHTKEDASRLFGFETELFNIEEVSDICFSEKEIRIDIEKLD